MYHSPASLQEPLGLKLDVRRATVKVTIIDSVERPRKTDREHGRNRAPVAVSKRETLVEPNQPAELDVKTCVQPR